MNPVVHTKNLKKTLMLLIISLAMIPIHAYAISDVAINMTIQVNNNEVKITAQEGTTYSFTCPNNITTTTTLYGSRGPNEEQQQTIRDCTQMISEQAQTIKDRIAVMEKMNITQITTEVTETRTACLQTTQKQDASNIMTALSACQQELLTKGENGILKYGLIFALGIAACYAWIHRGSKEE